MPDIPERGCAQREEVAAELEDAGWPAVAADVRDGVDYDVILRRLREIGEGDSDAAEIIIWRPQPDA